MSPSSSHALGVTPVAVYARLTANQAFAATPFAVPFNTTDFDPAGYFDLGNNRLVVPAGKAGLHLVGCQLQIAAIGGAGQPNYRINNSGNNSNVFASEAAVSFWNTTSALVVMAAVGDTFDLSVGNSAAFTGTVTGGVNGSVLWAIYLGVG